MHLIENFQVFILILQLDFLSSSFGIYYLNIHFYSPNLILNALFLVSNIKSVLERKRHAIIQDLENNVPTPKSYSKTSQNCSEQWQQHENT